jgi:cupin superfamily acireductone dioxygenase involved in methionine salvage
MKNAKRQITDLIVARKYVALVQSASKREIEVSISFAELKRVMKTNTCHFTGEELNHINEDYNQHSLDRIDNEKGYVKGNVVACSSGFNSVKGSLTVNQIKILMKGLKKSGLL